MQRLANLSSSHRWLQSFMLVCFYAFISTALVAPIASNVFIPGLADYVNHLAGIIEAKMALAEGQFPIRVAPDWGWRYPYFQFYSPSTYTAAALIYQWITPHNALLAFKITACSALTCGGFFMFRLIRWFVQSNHAALLGSLVYLMSPYYIIVINNFGDLSELIALSILPAAIYYTLQGFNHPNYQRLLQIALVWYLLLTTHIVTFVYTSLFMGLLLTFIMIKNPHHIQKGLRVGIAYAFSCLLSAWYLAPLVLFGNQTLISATFSHASSFSLFTPVFSQLIFPAAKTFKVELIHNHPSIGWLILISFGICLIALLNKSRISSKRGSYWLPFLLILFAINFLLIWSPINFWQWMPTFLMIGQYSWRLLDQCIWIGPILFAWGTCWLFKDQLDLRHTIIGIFLITAMSCQWFPTLENAKIDLKTFSKKPYLTYNYNAYLMDFNNHTQYVDAIDTLMLYSLQIGQTLQLNTPYTFNRTLLNHAAAPTVTVLGKIPETFSKPGTTLAALVNNQVISTYKIKPGDMKWEIPLSAELKRYPTLNKFIFQFKVLPDNPTSPLKIPVSEVLLTKFMSEKDTMLVKAVEPFCKQNKAITSCDIDVPANIIRIELPFIYYPKMLEIKLNGKIIPHQSIAYYNYLIPSIKPIPGQKNHIEIEFCGLKWANNTSVLAWCMWLVLALYVLTGLIRCRKSLDSRQALP